MTKDEHEANRRERVGLHAVVPRRAATVPRRGVSQLWSITLEVGWILVLVSRVRMVGRLGHPSA